LSTRVSTRFMSIMSSFYERSWMETHFNGCLLESSHQLLHYGSWEMSQFRSFPPSLFTIASVKIKCVQTVNIFLYEASFVSEKITLYYCRIRGGG
jgi:hypothetical protein